jgi:DNA mismatch endonuclease (patch repair protein)
MSGRSLRSRAPGASSPVVRRIMLANYGDNLHPERQLRTILRNAGLRFRKDCRPSPALRCTADIVFPQHRLCVFVDGCFWHGCPRHFTCPRKNAGWWNEKIATTKERDKRQTRQLKAAGWRVIRVWEHDLEASSQRTLDLIRRALQRAKVKPICLRRKGQ